MHLRRIAAAALACTVAAGTATASQASGHAASPPPPPGMPAPPPDRLLLEHANFRALEAGTGLELTSQWSAFPHESRPGESFPQFARRKFRRKLGAGIGLSVAGLGVGALGMAIALIAASREDPADVDLVGGALLLTAGFSLAVPGSILWIVNQVRLHKLKRTGLVVVPRLHPGGAGLGVRLAF